MLLKLPCTGGQSEPIRLCLVKTAAPLPQARLREISMKLRSLGCLFFFSSPRDQGDVFPLSASFGADQLQVRGGLVGDIQGLRVTLCCLLLSLSRRLLYAWEKKAVRVTDKQHLISTDLYVRISFPICVSACNESLCEPCQEEIELHYAPLQDNGSY